MKNITEPLTIIPRPRLLQKIQQAAQHRLTLVSAPPGYGKTVLVTQFANQAPYPVIWHTVEDRERDVATLHQSSLAALQQVISQVTLPKTIAGQMPEELAFQVATLLRQHTSGHLIYVLDDVQFILGSLFAERWLKAFIAQLPPSCHLIIISRRVTDFPLLDMQTHRDIISIGQDELRLTRAEIEHLVSVAMGETAQSALVEDIELRLQGWTLGTALALYPLTATLDQTA